MDIFSGKSTSAHFAHIPKAQIFFEDILLGEYTCIIVTFPHWVNLFIIMKCSLFLATLLALCSSLILNIAIPLPFIISWLVFFYPFTLSWSISLYLKSVTVSLSVRIAVAYMLGNPLEGTTPIFSRGLQSNYFISFLQQWVTLCDLGLALSYTRKGWLFLAQIECSFCSAYSPLPVICLWPYGESTEQNHILGMQLL